MKEIYLNIKENLILNMKRIHQIKTFKEGSLWAYILNDKKIISLRFNKLSTIILYEFKSKNNLYNVVKNIQQIYNNIEKTKIESDVVNFIKEMKELHILIPNTLRYEKYILKKSKINNIILRNHKMHIPINVSWDISTKCNLKCKHCSFYSDEHIKEEVSSNDVFKIIKRLEEVGVLGVALLGGEPLLRKDIFNVISELKKRNMLVSISTNGSFTKNKSISLVNALRNVQIDNVQVSLESSNKITHEFIRGKDTYEKTIYFIKLLRSKSINSHISMTVGKHNIKEIDDTIKLSKNLGVGFRYTILLPIGRANKYMGQFLLDNKDFKYIVDRWRFWKENYPKTIIANDPTGGCPVNLDREAFCAGAHTFCTIKPNGDVAICDHLQDHIGGNLLESSMKEIVESEVFRNFRELKLNYIKSCKNCYLKNNCQGICRGNAYLFEGDILGKDPYCKFYHKLFWENQR